MPTDITIELFLHTVFEGLQDDEVVCLGRVPRAEGRGIPGIAWTPGAGQQVDYVAVSTMARAAGGTVRHRIQDVRAMYAVFLDDIVGKYPEPAVLPSWVLETSAGNFQWGYLLDVPLEGEALAGAVATWRLICRGRSDAVANPTRYMRVPGAVHRTGFIARIHVWAPSRVYTIGELADAFGVELVPGRVPPIEQRATEHVDDYVRDWVLECHSGRTGEDGKVLMECPWAHEHTTPGGDAAYFPLGYHGRVNRGFHCFHEHCAKRSIGDFLAWATGYGLAPPPQASTAADERAHLALMKRLPELDQMCLPDLRLGAKGPRYAQLASPSNVQWALGIMGITAYTCVQAKQPRLLADWSDSQTAIGAVLSNKLQRVGVDAAAKVYQIISDLCAQDRRHAALDALPAWDGVDRFEALSATITVPAHEHTLWRIYLRRWLLQAVKAWQNTYAATPVAVGGVLVLCGAQGVGKSRWIARLHPDAASGVTLALGYKDSVIECLACPIVELSELEATFRKADQEAMKAFLTRPYDTYRTPYAREAETWPRTTVFIGSVNTRDFLQDNTGSRRYWPVTTEHIDHDHAIDMPQVWAQARELLRGGERWWLDADEDRQRAQASGDYRAIADIEERYEHTRPAWTGHPERFVNVGDVGHLLGYADLRDPRARSVLGALLRRDYGERRQITFKGNRLKGWLIPIAAELGVGREYSREK